MYRLTGLSRLNRLVESVQHQICGLTSTVRPGAYLPGVNIDDATATHFPLSGWLLFNVSAQQAG